MKVKKLKDGRASVDVTLNQKITYDPQIDSYVIETDILGGQIHRTQVHSSVFDKLHNLAWEGKDS